MTAEQAAIEAYLDGWRKGDASALIAHADEAFYFDDPNRGRIYRDDYATYVEEIWAEAAEYRGATTVDHLEDLSEIVVALAGDGVTNVWFWWAIAGTPIEGSSLVKVKDARVISETICYYGRSNYERPSMGAAA